ncbi:MAG TPA: hypothetical protein VNW72_14265 [Chthoniobacterales bacterium]|jgi:hypothetical protein|nr:hypothetical protein [Chthoniobacterales bacterium]
MLSVRYLLLLIIPLLIIGIPTQKYIADRGAGEIPTRAEWESAPHSSGPWSISFAKEAWFRLTLCGVLISVVGAVYSRIRRRPIRIWVLHAGAVLVASYVALYFFGYLML